jgi:bifunctional non-homologous end joining protein LigD
MGLKEYRRKRRFDVTNEPRGQPAASARVRSGNSYVVQKHAASRLHYDFRLELDGVLKSWAVPKGPSLDPRTRALAVQVEDHPVEYGSFEGIIPAGQYGGGTVLLWDRGHWEAIGDARRDYELGKLKFTLHGEKLKGIWNLVRMRDRTGRGKTEWLLIKHPDEHARPGSGYAYLEEAPLSVVSGRDLKEIAALATDVWQSHRPARGRRKALRRSAPQPIDPAAIGGARRAAQPEFLTPQLATLTTRAPEGEDWLHEVKLDGYRMLGVLRDGRATLLSRRGNDWTPSFAVIAGALEGLPLRNAILDGEVVALNKEGMADFQALQNVMQAGGRATLAYFLFDVLHY